VLPSRTRPLPEAFRPTGRPGVVAHRGASDVAPENTLAAFDAAWRAGADAIELDVQLTADGVPVVIHDDTVDSTTNGSGAVGLLTFEALRRLDAGSWFSPEFAGQPVPALDEVLTFLATRPELGLLLEYKRTWAAADVALTTAAVDAAGVTGRVVVQSFWPATIAALHDVAPHLPRGLLVGDEQPEAAALARELGVVTVNPSTAAVRADPGIVDRLHAAGFSVMVWTENDPDGWQALAEAGVDAVITDRPEHLLGWLADSANRPAPPTD
jgi:glycerophosphoryl diester phosphodiesterase